jgi:hypothetical protein
MADDKASDETVISSGPFAAANLDIALPLLCFLMPPAEKFPDRLPGPLVGGRWKIGISFCSA